MPELVTGENHMSEIKRLHEETQRLVQQSLKANLLFVAYLLDIARLELDHQLKNRDDGKPPQEHCMPLATCRLPKAQVH